MKQVERILKIIVLIILIFLASLGIGIAGIDPIALFKLNIYKKNETKIELVEEQEKETDTQEIREIN